MELARSPRSDSRPTRSVGSPANEGADGAMKSKLLLLATLLATTTMAQTPTITASTPAGGRVILQQPFRGLDTRDSGGPTTGPVGLFSLSHVWVFDSTQPGTATIYPCGQTPGSDPSALFDAHEVVYT